MNALLIIIFLLGYIVISFESSIKINKSATALIAGVMCWVVYLFTSSQSPDESVKELIEHLAEISSILFFLLAAMTIVELMDAHDGFEIIKSLIQTRKKIKLLWIISFITFFLSAVLDNLTTTIVMISLLRKLIDDDDERMLFAGMIIIAANAGGAWSPIGDITTTMLWIGGQITAVNIILKLFLPSFICMIVPLVILSFKIKSNSLLKTNSEQMLPSPKTIYSDSLLPLEKVSEGRMRREGQGVRSERNLIFTFGIIALLLVPVFKSVTHLPPFMGILLSLGLLWLFTEIIHRKKNTEEKNALSVSRAMQRIDTPSILFFLGILLAVAALQSASVLVQTAEWMQVHILNMNVIVIITGLFSAIVDNVPLVAACIGMYPLAVNPTDSYLWEFLAYCTGTGGSILIIGSAAGVVAMGMEKMQFGWYVKRIAPLALAGYFAGAIVYMLLQSPLY